MAYKSFKSLKLEKICGASMIGKTPSEKATVTMSEASEVLEERKKEGELGYEQKLALEHVKKFSKLSSSEAKKLKKEIMDMGIGEAAATKVADIVPTDIIQLKQTLIIERKTVDEGTVQNIMKAVESHRGK
jgi:DNA-directed RNA polymerase subunit F